MKTTRKILSLLLVLVMCLCMLTACGENGDATAANGKDDTTTTTTNGEGGTTGDKVIDPNEEPYKAIARAYATMLSDLGGTYVDMVDDIPAIVDGTATYEISANVEGVNAELTAVVDPQKLTASADVSVDMQGVSTEASLWLGDDIAVKMPDLLGDKAYGVKLSTIMDDLDNSWILSMLDVDSADALLEMLLSESGIAMSDLNDLEAALGELEDLGAALGDTVTDTVETLADELTDYLKDLKTDVTANGDSAVITTTVTADDVADLMVILADTLEPVLDDLMGSLPSGMIDEELNLDELRNDAEGMRGEAGELRIIHTLSKDGKLQKFEFCFVVDGEVQDENAAVVFADGDAFGFEVFVEDISMLSFKSLSGDKEGFELTIPEEEAVLLFERNKSNGDFTVEGKSYGETAMMVKGNLQYGKDKFAIALDSITMDGETMELDVTVSIKEGGKVKALPNYQNVLTMSQSQLQSLLSEVQNSSLLEGLM